MMYMITNGNSYIHIAPKNNSSPICIAKDVYYETDDFSQATFLKEGQAKEFLCNRLDNDIQWGIRKVKSVNSGKNYVITTGCKYVASAADAKNGISRKYAGAKWFRSVADAETYLRSHDVFENAIIVDENGVVAETSVKKTFTQEQLQILGIAPKIPVKLPVKPPVKPQPIIKPASIKTKRTCIQKTMREKVYEKGGGICAICGRPISFDHFTVDHIVPLSRGGKNEFSNYQIACCECNQFKGSKNDEEMNRSVLNIAQNIIQNNTDSEFTNELIRTIVRSKIRGIFRGAK